MAVKLESVTDRNDLGFELSRTLLGAWCRGSAPDAADPASAVVRDRLGEIRTPTLVIAGELDMSPITDKEAIAAGIPSSELSVVAGSRHSTPIGAAAAFNALMLEFLNRLSGAEEDIPS